MNKKSLICINWFAELWFSLSKIVKLIYFESVVSMGVRGMKMVKTGDTEYVVYGWDEVKDEMDDDVKAIEILKQFVMEKLNAKLCDMSNPLHGEHCDDDEAFHIILPNNKILHVCISDPGEVRIFPE